MTTISFRPHQFLCALSFQGKGYSPAFVKNFTKIIDKLTSDESEAIKIKVVDHADDICMSCPNRRDMQCVTEQKVAAIDKAHATTLHIKIGDTLTWKEAKQRIAKHMILEKFHQACATCEWKKFGMCEDALTKHLKESHKKIISIL